MHIRHSDPFIDNMRCEPEKPYSQCKSKNTLDSREGTFVGWRNNWPSLGVILNSLKELVN